MYPIYTTGAARVEHKLVRWCLDVVGFPSSSAGYIESGCSRSTLLAIVTARESMRLKPVDFERYVYLVWLNNIYHFKYLFLIFCYCEACNVKEKIFISHSRFIIGIYNVLSYKMTQWHMTINFTR